MRVARTIFIIFLLVLVCSVPVAVVHAIDRNVKQPIRFLLVHILYWLQYCLNVLVYVLMNRQYRDAYVDCLARVFPRFKRHRGIRFFWEKASISSRPQPNLTSTKPINTFPSWLISSIPTYYFPFYRIFASTSILFFHIFSALTSTTFPFAFGLISSISTSYFLFCNLFPSPPLLSFHILYLLSRLLANSSIIFTSASFIPSISHFHFILSLLLHLIFFSSPVQANVISCHLFVVSVPLPCSLSHTYCSFPSYVSFNSLSHSLVFSLFVLTFVIFSFVSVKTCFLH